MTPPISDERRAELLVKMFIEERLANANDPPGLLDAIIDGIVPRLGDITSRGRQQIEGLRSPSSQSIPDAYLADEEVVEDELQAGAAGIRTARELVGVVSDPHRFEYNLAQVLASNAQWPLRGEASRVPRPSTRASVLDWSWVPIPWLDNDAEWPPAGSGALDGVRQLPGAQAACVTEAPYSGWVQLGMIERQRTLASSYPHVPARQILIATGLEVGDRPPPPGSMPLSSSPPSLWAVAHERLEPGIDTDRSRTLLNTASGPLVALVGYDDQPGVPNSGRGIGMQRFTLVPRIEVVALLGLQPEFPALRHVLIDDEGPALVSRQWRGFLVHDGNYRPLQPAVHGTDLILRPDLYDILEESVGRDRLTLGITVSHSESES